MTYMSCFGRAKCVGLIDRKHFEYLLMDAMQCGLNWTMMLKKREVFRQCVDDFDYKRFYRDCPILKADETVCQARVALTELTQRVLRDGCELLGMECPEEM